MILTSLTGGLGNQMFQFAHGHALSKKYNLPHYLDLRSYAGETVHNGYELSRIFGLNHKVIDRDYAQKILGWRDTKIGNAILRSQLIGPLFINEKYIQERGFSYQDVDISIDTKFIYLRGYWQSEKYFLPVASEIKDIFSFPVLSLQNIGILKEINASANSVSIHIRRGDYVSNSKAAKHHGVCSIEYYEKAIASIIQSKPESTFFVFSDEPQWAKDNLSTYLRGRHYFISHNLGNESYQDMQLMGSCNDNIIANSSFSWWAAWLNPNVNRTVIAPKRWFKANLNTADLYPSDWLLI